MFSVCIVSPHSPCFLPDAHGKAKGDVMCREHREADMINLKAPKCSIRGCYKAPSRDYIRGRQKEQILRQSRHTKEMVIIRRECATEGCKVAPNYGFERSRTHCFTHKQPGMGKPNTVARARDLHVGVQEYQSFATVRAISHKQHHVCDM